MYAIMFTVTCTCIDDVYMYMYKYAMYCIHVLYMVYSQIKPSPASIRSLGATCACIREIKAYIMYRRSNRK